LGRHLMEANQRPIRIMWRLPGECVRVDRLFQSLKVR
jgi:hypothetical protein